MSTLTKSIQMDRRKRSEEELQKEEKKDARRSYLN